MNGSGEAVGGLVKSRIRRSRIPRWLRPRWNMATPPPLARSRIPPATQAKVLVISLSSSSRFQEVIGYRIFS